MSKNKKKRRSYLGDITLDAEGRYAYTGVELVPTPPNGIGTGAMYGIIAGLSAAAVLFCIIGGCIPAAGMQNTFYVILPYIFEISFAVSVLWAALRMLWHGRETGKLRKYVWEATYGQLGVRTVLTVIASAVCAAATVLFIILSREPIHIPATVVFFITKAATIFTVVLLRRFSKRIAWETEQRSLMNG